MKTIEFEGKQYEVEDWVKFVARDEDGSINGYEAEPYQSRPESNEWCCRNIFRICSISETFDNWDKSLTEV